MLLTLGGAERPAVLAPFGRSARPGPSTPDAAEGPTADLGKKRCADHTHSSLDVSDDEGGLDPNDAISGALERRISARIREPALAVIRAIDLDDEALRGSQKVRDEATEQRHLPTKEHTQAAAANASPEELFRSSR